MKNKLKVLMVSAEVAPFAKVGGLADVVGSLPPALVKKGCEVRIIMPKYGSIDAKKYKLKKVKSRIKIESSGRGKYISLWKANLPGSKVVVYFIEQKDYFGKKELYYGNSSERFLFFSLAVLTITPYLDFDPNVIHCHDFHSALICDLIKANKNKWGKYKTLYTIHNLNYQGKSNPEVLSTGNLTRDSLKSLSYDAQDGDINFMVQGILNADRVNTVSPTYSREIASHEYGAGLDGVIKDNLNKISGILNGIDVDFFNPEKDKFIKYNYSYKTLSLKDKNKLFLQKKCGLPQDKNIPLVGFVSRLAWQKGLELIDSDLCSLDCQFVFLGTGERRYEKRLEKLAQANPGKVSANIMFDVGFAQEIYAGSDIFLMPSRFEPCGLGQMIAMRYGAVPVVRSTGGLADTVDSKLGFKFREFDAHKLHVSLEKALKVYFNNKSKWQELQKNGMKKDFSWEASAGKYIKVYREILR